MYDNPKKVYGDTKGVFGQNEMLPNFSPTAVQNTACGDTDGQPGAGWTLNHHSLDPYGGHGMGQQHLISCRG